MSTKPETQFTSSIHRYLPATLHHEKMNNPYRGGTADVWYSGKNDLWVEYKFIPRIPIRSSILPNCSQLQLEWLKGRYLEGRNVAVIVGTPKGGVIYRDRTWEKELSGEEFITYVQDRRTLAEWILATTAGITTGTIREVRHGDQIRRGDLSHP